MSDPHNLRPWYSRLPLTAMILAAPFAFIALCGDQWLPEQSTFATLAKHKQKPQLHLSQEDGRTLLHATSWLSWPPLSFDRCDLQPVKKPRIGICFSGNTGHATLVEANIEQLVQIGLTHAEPANGRWIGQGRHYLLGQTLIYTEPQLQVSTLPAPLEELDLPRSQRPQLVTLSPDEALALWIDQRPSAEPGVHVLITRTLSGHLESELTVQHPALVSQLRDPDIAPWLVRRLQHIQAQEELHQREQQVADEPATPDSVRE